MCGIAGVVGAMDVGTDRALESMLNAMLHRGPDQNGTWQTRGREVGAALGHRRLSIIDLSEAGRQPMIDEQTGAVISYNGECYNYLELRAELEALGTRFKSSSDTEVVLAAYGRWGAEAISRLRGMFALAIWDPRSQELLLARDRLGVKPVYYAQVGDRFLFASELRALLATGLIERSMDPKSLDSYLWHGFVPGPHTLVEGIRLMEAGTTLQVGCDGRPRTERRYWQLPAAACARDANQAIVAARDELQRAIEMRLVSDVPLGIFLSGGVDSSVVAAMAQRASSRPVATFNIRFEEAQYDESVHARKVAGLLGTDHHEVTLSEQAFADGLDAAIDSIDQPTFDAINTYFVSHAVREAGLTVALAGTGGDELFGGYASFVDLPRARVAASTLGHLPQRARGLLARNLCRVQMGRGSEVPPQSRWGKLADVLATRGDRVGLYQVAYAMFSDDFRSGLALQANGQRWGLGEERIGELEALIRGEDDLTAISKLELTSFIGERLLRDTDAASMAVSLEVRVPLLDHAFVEAMAAVPSDVRYQPIGKKTLLKQMVSDQLDASVFDRDKAGFELPLDRWCRNTLTKRLNDTFRDINLAGAVGLDAETVGRLWRAFGKDDVGIYWSRIWALYVLMNWCRKHEVYLNA